MSKSTKKAAKSAKKVSKTNITIDELFEFMGVFASHTFVESSAVDHLKKLIKESNEAINNPCDIVEYADCLLCLFAAAYKSGINYDQLLNAACDKFDVITKREWQRGTDGLYQHVD